MFVVLAVTTISYLRYLLAQPVQEQTPLFGAEAITIRMVARPTEPPKVYAPGILVDDLNAWMLNPGSFLRTQDGGRTWSSLEVSEPDRLRVAQFYDMPGQAWFVDAKLGFLSIGNGIWRTVDGGDVWSLISRGGFTDLQFFDNEHAWMSFYLERENRFFRQMHRSSDGGRTWLPCGPINDRDMSDITAAVENFGYWPQTAYFLDRDVGWAIGTKAVRRNKTDGVFYTSDGGCNWKLIWENSNSGINPDESFVDIQFIDNQRGWLVGGYLGGLFVTQDGGRTWVVVAEANIPVPDAVFFQSSNEGWLITTSNQAAPMMHTFNGGLSWSLLYPKDIASSNFPINWHAGRFLQLLAKSRLTVGP